MFFNCRSLGFALQLVELGLEHVDRHFTVLMLAALDLASHDEPGRQVGDANGRTRLVDMLATCAGAAKEVELEVFITHVDVDVLIDHRGYVDCGKTGVPSGVAVERRNADEAVNPFLGLQIPIGELAFDLEGDSFDALLLFLEVEDLILESGGIEVATIHAIQHGGPIARFRSARSGFDGQIGVRAIKFLRQECRQLEVFDATLQRVELGKHLGEHAQVVFGFGHG
jgi:hypothetical protein